MRNPKSFDDLIPHMKRAGFVATATAAVITAKFGWSLGEDAVARAALAVLLALCTFIVGYSLVAAYHAYERQMRTIGHAAVALFCIGVCVEFMAHTGFTASNRDATIQNASLQTTAYDDARGTVKDGEAKLDRLRSERSLMKPTASPAAAKAVIEKTEAHKWWNGLTDNCKTTKGSQTRAFCEAYFSAKADLALWDQIAAQETKIAAAESELKDARAASGAKSSGHAAGASQGVILAAMATGVERPNEQAVFWAGVGISAIIALFAIAAGGLLNFIAWSFDPKGAREAIGDALEPLTTTIVEKLDNVPLRELAASRGLRIA